MGPFIQHLMAQGLQVLLHKVFQVDPGMITANGDTHGCKFRAFSAFGASKIPGASI
jgi:homoaconitase/3-isopropylmalate dehydratase large subunit